MCVTPQKELEDAALLAETKLNVSSAHAAAAIAQNEQLAQAASEAVQQLDAAGQTIQELSTRAQQQAEEHQLKLQQVRPSTCMNSEHLLDLASSLQPFAIMCLHSAQSAHVHGTTLKGPNR